MEKLGPDVAVVDLASRSHGCVRSNPHLNDCKCASLTENEVLATTFINTVICRTLTYTNVWFAVMFMTDEICGGMCVSLLHIPPTYPYYIYLYMYFALVNPVFFRSM